MWNINYDECHLHVICSVSAVTCVGGSRSHGDNEPSVVNSDEETELLFVSGGRRTDGKIDGRRDGCCF